MPRVEPSRGDVGRSDDDRGPELPVDRAFQAFEVDRGIEVGVDDLGVGMDSRVGSASADQLDLVAAKLRYRTSQLSADGALPWLAREPVEPGSVVGENYPDANCVIRSWRPFGCRVSFDWRAFVRRRAGLSRPRRLDVAQTNSMRAMGAASPWRGPSFKMRV
jgi:hypothetical protein